MKNKFIPAMNPILLDATSSGSLTGTTTEGGENDITYTFFGEYDVNEDDIVDMVYLGSDGLYYALLDEDYISLDGWTPPTP